MFNRQALETTLTNLFNAERTVRKLHDELAAAPPDQLLDILTQAIAAAIRQPDENEASLRLVHIASLLGEHHGPRFVDALIDVLASDHPEARQAAGEELEVMAYERFKDVAQGIERALKRLPAGSPALSELPYLISDIPEPGVGKLLKLFLEHKDADAVAAALEVLVELGDTTYVSIIMSLVGDDRIVEIADNGTELASNATLGELARDALDLLDAGKDDNGAAS